MLDNEILLDTGTNEFEIIEFFIDEVDGGTDERDYFGINVAKVLEVVEAPDGLEAADGAPHPSYLGTMSLRDIILPVIDLAVWLGIERKESDYELIVVTEINNVITGFLVTGVTQIHRIGWGDLKTPNKYIADLDTNCITGTVHLEDRFVLMIDLERILGELDPEMAERSDGQVYTAPEKMTAVLVDDSVSVRALLNKNFESANFEVKLYTNGQEALEALKEINAEAKESGGTINNVVDIVVSDIEMPQMDGYTLTRSIKEHADLSCLPVILFSSLITKGLYHKGEAVKADDQITKPEFNELTGRAISLIEKYRAKRQ
ncbi:chemotaxis protein [Maridesulfovibrio salexigens]|uniref:Response regulator receiver modulated CheW protein n=1 Tax=Maridesulfovibrio salexigens (strain ATCC 14822 / DSM 2638 / NCIMB 8403 / VKM B-1763) TaxID=526222 RepID=C6BYY7_MARSD|nr:chemotaxis protein [Maridesulfovibrio salexigens]ACS78811.1 response regulator receiver modulated CheW protein [Maridesulfovibrio salexigens DSM 2638]